MALDTRIFFLFTGENETACDVSRVTIIRPQQQDIALVRDQIPGDRQADIARRIQTTYAGVKQVIFSDAPARPANTLFDRSKQRHRPARPTAGRGARPCR